MSKRLSLAVCGFAVLTPLAVLAQEAPDTSPDIPAVLECRASGYDVFIYNRSPDPIPAGSTIDWGVEFARADGSHTLSEDLEPQDRVALTAVLGSTFLNATRTCEATIAAATEDDTGTVAPAGATNASTQ